MSFPGHAKSIEINRGPRASSPISPAKSTREVQETPKRDELGSGTTRRRLHDGASPDRAVAHGLGDEIIDDKGNKPSRSLWVGNTVQGLRASQLYDIFGVFGPIESATTKPTVRYSFVNFQTVEDATRAWQELNGKPVFQSDQPLYIRFTTTESEAKQSKEAAGDRKFSISVKSKGARQDRHRNDHQEKKPEPEERHNQSAWPNGLPPTGPKSHRTDISPPPLRRGDVYRPADRFDLSLDHQPRRHSVSRRDSRRESKRRGPDVYRPSDLQRSRSRSQSSSKSWSDRDSWSSSGYSSPQTAREDSPHRLERFVAPEKSAAPPPPSELRALEAKRRAQAIASSLIPQKHKASTDDAHISGVDRKVGVEDQPTKVGPFSVEAPDLPASELSYVSRSSMLRPELDDEVLADRIRGNNRSLPNLDTDTPTCGTLLHQMRAHNYGSFESTGTASNKRLRIEKDESCSVTSDVTSSTKSSIRKKKCTDCKKLGSDLSPLTACSLCPRRFHSACGDPRPSSCAAETSYICGRCSRGENTILRKDLTTDQTAHDRQSQLASPPLSLTNNDLQDISFPSEHGNLTIDTSAIDITSFFQLQTPLTPATSSFQLQASRSSAVEQPVSTTYGSATQDISCKTIDRQMLTRLDSLSSKHHIQSRLEWYRQVTCHWWKRGQCWLDQDRCLYAHRDTGIYRPDGKHANKFWTCWDWLSSHPCPESDQTCFYAHRDTGLYLWSDTRVSLKHITCIWWIKSDSCKWSAADCRFAHQDTGVYALEPADKRARGSAISTERPVPQSRVPVGEARSQFRDAESYPLSSHPAVNPMMDGLLAKLSNPFMRTDSVKAIATENRVEHQLQAQSMETVPIYAHPRRKMSLLVEETENNMQKCQPTTQNCPRQGESLVNIAHIQPYALHNACSSQVSAPLKTQFNVPSEAQRKLPQASSIDPRRRRLTAPSDILVEFIQLTKKVASAPVLSTDEDLLDSSIVSPDRTEPISKAPDHGATTAIPSVKKKCEVCSKIVFNDVRCRGCKDSKTVSQGGIPDKTPQLGPSGRPSLEQDRGQDSEQTLDKIKEVIKGDFGVLYDGPPKRSEAPILKLPIKKRAAGGGMFIPNKRPKLMMAFSHAGPLHSSLPVDRPKPATTSRQLPKMINDDCKLETRSIEQLTIEARLQNAKSTVKSALTLDATADHATNLRTKQCEQIDMVQAAPNISPSNIQRHLPESPTLSPEVDEDVFYSDDENMSLSSFNSATSELDPPDIPYSASTEQTLDTRNPPITMEWSQSSSPGHLRDTSKLLVRACRDCNEKHRRCTHKSTEVSDSSPARAISAPKLITSVGENDRGDEPKLCKQLNTITGLPVPYVCGTCRRHHKKCLHDENGNLDPARCSSYLVRKSRKSSDRSNLEWVGIQRAARIFEQEGESLDGSPCAETMTDTDKSRTTSSHTSIVSENEADHCKYEQITETLVSIPESPIIPPEADLETKATPRLTRTGSPAKIQTNFRRDIQTTGEFHQHNAQLINQGIMFESDTEDEDYLSEEVSVAPLPPPIIDPLRAKSLKSCNLYDILPDLHPQHQDRHVNGFLPERPRPSRKEEWGRLRKRQMQERRALFGNPHRELDRARPETMVKALVERVMSGTRDDLVPVVQIREEAISFRDFIGLPRQPVACLLEDNMTLAYRDAVRDNDRNNSTTSTRGFIRQVTEEDRLPVYDK